MQNEQKGTTMKTTPTLRMMKPVRAALKAIAATFAVASAFTANAYNTYTFNVPEGQTDTVTNMIERLGYSAITHGDTIKKTGLGQLSLLDNSFPIRANLQIEEGGVLRGWHWSCPAM